jgi:hypothetical protein
MGRGVFVAGKKISDNPLSLTSTYGLTKNTSREVQSEHSATFRMRAFPKYAITKDFF